MKQMLLSFLFTLLFCASSFAVPEYGRYTDVLNPEFQRRIDEYLRVVDRWIEEGAPYTLTETYRPRGPMFATYVPPHYIYRLKAPDYVLDYQKKEEKWFLCEMSHHFYEDDNRSYVCLALFLGKRTDNFHDIVLTNNTPLVTNNQREWNQVRDDYRHYYAFFLRTSALIEYRSNYLTNAIAEQVSYPVGKQYLNIYNEIFLEQLPTEKWIQWVAKIPFNKKTLSEWLSDFCFKWYPFPLSYPPKKKYFLEENLLRGYEVWAPQYAATNANVCALMAGVAILDGYHFDSSTGIYHLNDIGKRAISIVAKYPHAETAFFLKTIREGGNQAYIDELFRKFGTETAWRKLFAEAKAPPPESKTDPEAADDRE